MHQESRPNGQSGLLAQQLGVRLLVCRHRASRTKANLKMSEKHSAWFQVLSARLRDFQITHLGEAMKKIVAVNGVRQLEVHGGTGAAPPGSCDGVPHVEPTPAR